MAHRDALRKLRNDLLKLKGDEMAILRKCKLSWATSNDPEIIGYRIYWDYGPTVGYHSQSFVVGKVSQTEIPDGIALTAGPVMFGITAIHQDGNESDMTTLSTPFELQVPDPPRTLSLESVDSFTVIDDVIADIRDIEVIRDLVAQLETNRAPLTADLPTAADEHNQEDASAAFDIGSLF